MPQRKLSEAYVANVLQQVLCALRSLHRDHRIHKDIKLDNLMLLRKEGAPHVVLIDLGLAEKMPEDGHGPVPAGTPGTMATSLGVAAFELLVGHPPYATVHEGGPSGPIHYRSTRAMMTNLGIRARLVDAGRSEKVADLVELMLTIDPAQRPSALECLHHEWLLQHRELRRHRCLRAEGRHSLSGASASLEEEIKVGNEVLTWKRAAIATSLIEFSRQSAGQRAAAYFLAAHMPVSQLPMVTESFNRIDKNLEAC